MNTRYIMQADPKPPKPPHPPLESDSWVTPLLLIAFAFVAFLCWHYRRGISAFFRSLLEDDEQGHDRHADERNANPTTPSRVAAADSSQPIKPRVTLTLGDVNDPSPRPAANSKPNNPPPATAAGSPSQTRPTVNESNQPASSAAPGDFEKALAQAGQRMDALLKQTEELNRAIKLSEKAKMDAQNDLSKATTELKNQLDLKDEQIAKLDALLDRKSTFPSLRALIDVKKLCLDMLNTQKEVSREEMVNFVTAEIDSQLANLEIQVAEFAVGTPLEKIPGEQVETDRRREPTDDPAKNNQVARLLRPCYYLERDSKRIVVAKALVILYHYAAASQTSESAPSTPAN